MKMKQKWWLLFVWFFFSIAYAAQSLETSPQQDEIFRQLRQAANNADYARAITLANQLQAYPIRSYVEYYLLKSKLKEATASEVEQYIQKYAGSAIADRLRNDWLLLLGRNGEWQAFDEHYPLFALKDDTQVTCYSLLSRLRKNESVASEAKKALVEPR